MERYIWTCIAVCI